MKSYSEYHKEQLEEKEKKIDKMKPEVRLDYFNRVNRVEETHSYEFSKFPFYIFAISILTFLFSLLFFSMETENSLLISLPILKISGMFALIGFLVLLIDNILFYILWFLQIKNLNKLDEKYNL